MAKYIVVGDSSEYIPVIDAYAFIYDYGHGKTVLRIRVKTDVKSFEELEALFEDGPVVNMYEDSTEETNQYVHANVFENFCKDYSCEYNSEEETFDIEITKKTDTELAIEANQSLTLDAYAAIAEVYEM